MRVRETEPRERERGKTEKYSSWDGECLTWYFFLALISKTTVKCITQVSICKKIHLAYGTECVLIFNWLFKVMVLYKSTEVK